MSDLEKLTEYFMQENTKASTERSVLKRILTTLIARQANEQTNPEEYIMTLTASPILGFDETEPEDKLGRIAYAHGASYCNEIETTALDLLRDIGT